MKIIKEHKGNYELYDLIENSTKARQFREENAQSLKFYRLINSSLNNKGLFSQIKSDSKRIYELSLNTNFNAYTLSECPEYEDSLRIKIKNQQINFIEQFIQESLSKYTFIEQKANKDDNELYIFLNSYNNYLDETFCLKYYGMENVVHLPNELATQYLLEEANIKAGLYLNRIANKKLQSQLLNTFDVDLSSTLTQKQYEDLVNLKIIDEEQFTRNRKFNAPIANLINKKR